MRVKKKKKKKGVGGCSHSTQPDIQRSVFDISQHPVEREKLRAGNMCHWQLYI